VNENSDTDHCRILLKFRVGIPECARPVVERVAEVLTFPGQYVPEKENVDNAVENGQ